MSEARTSRPELRVVAGGKADDTRAALRELYTSYGGSVYGRCQYLLRDRAKAEDAMQDVFAKALSHWG
jgi:RNA polymerase sigma-70 factor (ECF subfamily)